jgi:hypothetical protein
MCKQSDRSRDQNQPCTNGDHPDTSRGALTISCEPFNGDGSSHDGHYANVHDAENQ